MSLPVAVTAPSGVSRASGSRWLLLIHQIPPKPDYFRVKVRRRLHQLGAIPIKSSVYALPVSEQTREDFEWLAREIAGEGGETAVCEASFVAGLGDDEIRAMFQAERDAEYAEVAAAAGERVAAADPARLAVEIPRLRQRMERITRTDFFDAAGRQAAQDALAEAELASRTASAHGALDANTIDPRTVSGRTWVTRRDVHVDRIASAWLIRRFIDRRARFSFVGARGYVPRRGELRFDMFDAEYTHEGDRCTFETLLARFDLRERGLRAIGEIVHDVDYKDDKFGRAETAGVALLVAGIVRATDDDAARLERGAVLFDELYGALGGRAP